VYLGTYSSKYIDAGQAKEIKKNWDSIECRVSRKSSLVTLVRSTALGITLPSLKY